MPLLHAVDRRSSASVFIAVGCIVMFHGIKLQFAHLCNILLHLLKTKSPDPLWLCPAVADLGFFRQGNLTSSGVNAIDGSGGPMESAEREPISEVWGGAPAGSRGRVPGQGVGGEAP